MYPLLKTRSRKAGLPPGTLIPSEDKGPVSISIMSYNQQGFTEKLSLSPKQSLPAGDEKEVHWIHVQGIHDPSIVESLGEQLHIHRLVIEDIVTPGQRPKVEEYENYAFFVLRALSYNEKMDGGIEDEQVCLVLCGNILISFQERASPLFEGVRERIRTGRGNIRRLGADFLAYALFDVVVDHYFIVLEKMGNFIERVEEVASSSAAPRQRTIDEIHRLRRGMIFVRRSVWPLREVISKILRQEADHFSKTTLFYFRDVYDHTIQVVDTIEMFRDLISGILDIYRSGMSIRLNEIMKILTIVSTIFCPLTFLTGLFGMNFAYMPELQWHYAYPVALGFMGVIALCMLGYFKHKKWL